ncbi:hypothetical protein D9M69_678040 [compost metagenome]
MAAELVMVVVTVVVRKPSIAQRSMRLRRPIRWRMCVKAAWSLIDPSPLGVTQHKQPQGPQMRVFSYLENAHHG